MSEIEMGASAPNRSFTIPSEEAFDGAFGDTDTGADETEEMDLEEDSPDDDADTSEDDEDPDAADSETEDDQEEDADEEEDSDDDAEEEDGEDDEEEDFFDRKEIAKIKDPEARKVAEKAYRSMHSAFTKKAQEAAEVRRLAAEETRKARAATEDYDLFLATMSSDTGTEGLLLGIVENRPHVLTETVLVDLALRDPAQFEAAWDRYQEIAGDDTGRERKKFDRDRDGRVREIRNEQTEEKQKVEETRRSSQQIRQLAHTRAETHGLRSVEALTLIEEQVAGAITRARNAGTRITRALVEDAVDRAARVISKERGDERRKAERDERKEKVRGVKKALDRNRRSPQPASNGKAAVARKGPVKIPKDIPKSRELAWLVEQEFAR